ncbi:MAG: hypothetical protein KC519_14315, partial [Anaerolineae bacterium]|nr:hypothetical protein [Anaerolineae bacterium]
SFAPIVRGESEYWYWAWQSYDLEVEDREDQRGDLIAFTPAGTVNVLLSDVYPVELSRIDDAHAFVGARIDDQWSLYYLSSNSAHQVIELFDHSYMTEHGLGTIYRGHRYFIPDFMPMDESSVLVFNTDFDIYAIYDAVSGETARLNLRPWCRRDCVRVSADGRYIRYYVRGDDPYYVRLSTYRPFTYPIPRTLPYQLYEYDTITQTERLIFEQDVVDEGQTPPAGGCTPDEHGDRWFCTLYIDDDETPDVVADRKFIVYTDGHIEDVNADWQLRVLDQQWYFLDLDSSPLGCSDCIVRVYPDGNMEESFEFIIPENEASISSFNVQLLSEQRLLTYPAFDPMYAISRLGELTELGVADCCSDPISSDLYDPRTGFMIVIDRNHDYQRNIWDTRSFTKVATFPVGYPGVRQAFRDRAVVLLAFEPFFNTYSMYSLIDQQAYIFGLEERRTFMDAIPGGALLVDWGSDYQLAITFQAQDDGIYIWTPDEGETLLVDSAVSVPESR